MAQNNTFRTKRRRLASAKVRQNAYERRVIEDFVGVKRPLHEGMKSYVKRAQE